MTGQKNENERTEKYPVECRLDTVSSSRTSYGSKVKDSFDGILKHLRTSSKSHCDVRNVTQDFIEDPENTNRKPQDKLSTGMFPSKTNEKEIRSENVINDSKENCVTMRKKLLPRSASSAADSTTSVTKLRWQNDDKNNATVTNAAMEDSPMQTVNGVRHIPMKLRRKSEIANYKHSTKWMERPTDLEASETDVLLLKRWIDNTSFWSVEDNPLKSFRLKDEEIYDMDNDSLVVRCFGGKSLVTPPILISNPLDQYKNICDDIDEYEGDCDDEGKPHGKNVAITFKNGDTFRGDVTNGERGGYGILQFAGKKRLSK